MTPMPSDSLTPPPAQSWEPDDVDLFLFSAALWLPHRIHYDRAFAESEGHRGLVIHGPFQIARLVEAASAWCRPLGGKVVRTEFRHVASAYAGDSMVLTLEPADPVGPLIEVAARAEVLHPGRSATVTTTGTIVVQIGA
jgi:hydroxyacyl-ACP dehydratase HTD2-like protein with hotdog domain